MNLLIDKLHYSDTREEAKKQNLPDEDSILENDGVFCVYDGVKIMHTDPYPNPSPAKQAADLAAKETIDFLVQNKSTVEPTALIAKTVVHVNEKIKELNEKNGITPQTADHHKKQYAAVTGAFGFTKGNMLHFAQLNDSGVMVFDWQGNREVDFLLNQTPFIKKMEKLRTERKLVENSLEEHIFIRKELVNNAESSFEGKKLNFGVMNGEKTGEQFWHYGSTNLFSGQVALLYSDGFIPFVYNDGFTKLFFENAYLAKAKLYIEEKQKESEKYQKEKSLIVVKVE